MANVHWLLPLLCPGLSCLPCSCWLAQDLVTTTRCCTSARSSPAFPSCSANLSDSYFTNRQDRYVFLQDCPDIADFFTELVDAVGDVSLQLQGDDTVQVVEGMVHPYKGRAWLCYPAGLGWGGLRAKESMPLVALPQARETGARAWFCFVAGARQSDSLAISNALRLRGQPRKMGVRASRLSWASEPEPALRPQEGRPTLSVAEALWL